MRLSLRRLVIARFPLILVNSMRVEEGYSMLSLLNKLISLALLVCVAFLGYKFYENNGDLLGLAAGNRRQITASEISNRLSGIQELATAQYDYETVGILHDKWYFSEKKLIIGFRGAIKYGYDLSEIKPSDIKISGKTITVALPQPKVLSNELDSSYTKPLVEDNGWWNKLNSEDVVKAEHKAKQDAEYRAINYSSLKKTAESNAKTAIELLAKSMDGECQVRVVGQ